jgi:hypothetical protein
LSISIFGLPSVTLDVTEMGLCGGMSFLTRDIFESGMPQLRGKNSKKIPLPLAAHILSRLIDSFGSQAIVNRWLAAVQALDHDTVVWGAGLFHQTFNEVPGILDEMMLGIMPDWDRARALFPAMGCLRQPRGAGLGL